MLDINSSISSSRPPAITFHKWGSFWIIWYVFLCEL